MDFYLLVFQKLEYFEYFFTSYHRFLKGNTQITFRIELPEVISITLHKALIQDLTKEKNPIYSRWHKYPHHNIWVRNTLSGTSVKDLDFSSLYVKH